MKAIYVSIPLRLNSNDVGLVKRLTKEDAINEYRRFGVEFSIEDPTASGDAVDPIPPNKEPKDLNDLMSLIV